MPYAPMEFFFTAKETNDTQKHSTRLLITKSDYGGYDWRMVTYYTCSRDIVYLHLNTSQEIIQRIKPMLVLFREGEDPFESLDIRFPGFPSMKIMYNTHYHALDAIEDMVENTVHAWPLSMYDNRIVEESDEYADMPPLIPINQVEPDDDDDMPPLIPMSQVYPYAAPDDEDEDEDEDDEDEESHIPSSPIQMSQEILECECTANGHGCCDGRPEFCEPASPRNKRAKISHYD